MGWDSRSDQRAAVEFRYLANLLLGPGNLNTLTVSGTSGDDASYSGTLPFFGAEVPEPSVWLVRILGVGLVGMALRRPRRRDF